VTLCRLVSGTLKNLLVLDFLQARKILSALQLIQFPFSSHESRLGIPLLRVRRNIFNLHLPRCSSLFLASCSAPSHLANYTKVSTRSSRSYPSTLIVLRTICELYHYIPNKFFYSWQWLSHNFVRDKLPNLDGNLYHCHIRGGQHDTCPICLDSHSHWTRCLCHFEFNFYINGCVHGSGWAKQRHNHTRFDT
jgi:hypothetical protein